MCYKISQGIIDTVTMTSPICAEIACRSITSGIADKNIEKMMQEIKKRSIIMHKKLKKQQYKYTYEIMFAYIKTPSAINCIDFKHDA